MKDFKDAEKEREREDDKKRNMTRAERKVYDKEHYYLGLSEIVLLKPLAIQYYYGETQVKESAELEQKILESLRYCAGRTDITFIDHSNTNSADLSIDDYNRQALILDFLRQKSGNEGEDIFPVDNAELVAAKKQQFKDAPILFVLADFRKTKATRRVNMIFLVVDVEDGEVLKEKQVYFTGSPKKNLLNGYVYDVLESLGKNN